tara:strand:+ start:562 stop:2802 length:2241 start_codon:yes stop_codon:yes gene_type:complete
MASTFDPKYVTQGPNKGKWTIAFAASEGPSKYNKGGSFWFESEEAALKALEKYKSGTPKALRAKLKKLLANRTQITTAQLTSMVQKLWGSSRASTANIVYKLKKDFPEVLTNNKGKAIQVSLTGGSSEAFTDFLKEKLTGKEPLRTTAKKLVEESKVNIKEGTARSIIEKKFPNKVLFTGYEIDVTKAIEAYKKLPEQTKIDFQTGGPGQKGKYRKWLASQGLTQPTATQLFKKKLEEQELYKKAPFKGDKLAKETYTKRKAGLEKTSFRPYEEALTTLKKDLTDELGIKKVKQPGGGFRTPLDLAHRLSYEQIGKLGGKITPENLGIDAFKINREDIKSIENSLKPFYEEQIKLFNKAKKLDKIPFDLKKQIDANNNAIAEVIAEKSGGRLQGVQVNYNNLKIETTPIDYSKTLGAGMMNKPLSEIKPRSMDSAIVKLNLVEQMKKESNLSNKLLKLADKNVNNICSILGRSTFAQGGSGCARQMAEALEKDPIGIGNKIKDIKVEGGAVNRVKGAATTFLKFAGKGKTFAITAGVGAGAGALVKAFRNDDPDTYLSNENQMKAMLVDTFEEDTLGKAGIGGELAAAGLAVPGSAAVYKARRLPFTDATGKTRAAMGRVRSALGPVGKAASGFATPLGIGLTLPLQIASQLREGNSLEDIATNPLNYLGPAFAGTLTKEATRGMNPQGLLARGLRLGMSPAGVRGISKFFGLPGLALSLGYEGYDQYKKYQEGEGFLYNLLNKDE